MIAYTPTGTFINSSLAVAKAERPINAKSFDENGDFYFNGDPAVLDERDLTPIVNDDGERLFVDIHGQAYPESDLELVSRGFLVEAVVGGAEREVYVDRIEHALGPMASVESIVEAMEKRLEQMPEVDLQEGDSIEVHTISHEDDKRRDPHHN